MKFQTIEKKTAKQPKSGKVETSPRSVRKSSRVKIEEKKEEKTSEKRQDEPLEVVP